MLLRRWLLWVGVVSCCVPAGWGQRSEHVQSLAPYVDSPQRVVDKMLEAAQLKPGEVVYDLGCGDGRVLVTALQKFRAAKAVGVEISAKVVRAAIDTIRRFNLQDRAQVIHGNLMDQDVSNADVVTLYLLTSSNEILRPKLEKSMKPGSRVVSHDFEVKGWKPDRVEKAYSYNRLHTIYVYQMPPRPVSQ